MTEETTQPVPEEPKTDTEPKTVEQRLEVLEQQFRFLLNANAGVFSLLRALAEMKGVQLKERQVPGGRQFYWQEQGGRIVIPGKGN